MCECQSLQLNPIADVARCDWPIDGSPPLIELMN